jgi:hypothetical protein
VENKPLLQSGWITVVVLPHRPQHRRLELDESMELLFHCFRTGFQHLFFALFVKTCPVNDKG